MDADVEHELPISTPDREPGLAKTAASEFRGVSSAYSGFAMAQAARLALNYQESGKAHEPLELRDALLDDPAEVESLRLLAIEMHKKHIPKEEEPSGKAKKLAKAVSRYFRPPERPPVDISTESMRDAIGAVFKLAEVIKNSDEAKLREITGLYSNYKNLDLPHAERLDRFNEKAFEILPELAPTK